MHSMVTSRDGLETGIIIFAIAFSIFAVMGVVHFTSGPTLACLPLLLKKRVSLVAETIDGDLLGASSCHGPVVDGHHSHTCLITVEYQISWNAVLRHR